MQNDDHYITITLRASEEPTQVLQTAGTFLNNLEIPSDWNLHAVNVASMFEQSTQPQPQQQHQTETVTN